MSSRLLVQTTILFIGLVISAVALLIIASLLPSSWLKSNVGNSLTTLQQEGTYPLFGLRPRKIVLDNFTDALILNTAYSSRSDEPIKSALLNPRILVALNEIDQIKNLEASYLEQGQSSANYERYWHGYLVLLRPLLTLMSYAQIRLLLTVGLWGVFAWLLYQVWHKIHPARSAALLIAAMSVDFFYVGQSLQFSAVFFIGIMAALWYVRHRHPRPETLPLLFFAVGATTSFFDLLTAPLVSLAFLLVVTSRPDSKLLTFRNICFWVGGYAAFWVSKWLIVDVLYSQGVVRDALNHVQNRTLNPADENFSHFQTLKLNLQQLIGYDRLSKMLLLALATVASIFLIVYRKKNFVTQLTQSVLNWGWLALIPYAWYLIAANHSYLHVWYTYRSQFLTVACLTLIYAQLIDWKKVRSHFLTVTPPRHQRQKKVV